jgi:hypothetical protein
MASLVRSAVDGFIVQQHEMAITGCPDIDFNQICAKGPGFPNGGEGIFRGVAGGSPMTDAKDGSDSDL